MVEVSEYRVGRNFIRLGDKVKVKPSRPGKRDGCVARVRRIKAEEGEGGAVREVEVAPLTGKYLGSVRTFLPDRIERMSQTKGGAVRA